MSELIIQKESLSNLADKIREYIPPTIESKVFPTTLLVQGRKLDPEKIIEYYSVYSDQGEEPGDYALGERTYTHYSYGISPYSGKLVPVIYETSEENDHERSEYDDEFWYEGVVVYKGIKYDCWRKNDKQLYEPGGSRSCYIYTNRFVANGAISLGDMPDRIDKIANDQLRYGAAYAMQQVVTPNTAIFSEPYYLITQISTKEFPIGYYTLVPDLMDKVASATVYNSNPLYTIKFFLQCIYTDTSAFGGGSKHIVYQTLTVPPLEEEKVSFHPEVAYASSTKEVSLIGIKLIKNGTVAVQEEEV